MFATMRRTLRQASMVALLTLLTFQQIAHAAVIAEVTQGATDYSVTIDIIDRTDGTPETGVVYNTSGIDLWYRREGAALVQITEVTLAALTTAHTDGGFLHIRDGSYRLDLPDAAYASGAKYVDVGGTVTGMIVIGGRVQLNPTAIPADVKQWNGTNVATPATAGYPAVTLKVGTGTGEVQLRAGQVEDVGTVRYNTLAGAGVGYAQLDASASSISDTYNGQTLVIKTNTGAGQSFHITDYDGALKRAYIANPWITTPTSSSDYVLKEGVGTVITTSEQLAEEVGEGVWQFQFSEPAGPPSWTAGAGEWLAWMGAWTRNPIRQTNTTKTLRNDADSAAIGNCTVSDNGTTFTVSKCVAP